MTVIVAVDGGGSRCRLVAYDNSGHVLARTSVEEHASLSLGVTSAWQNIKQGLRSLRQCLSVPPSWQPDHLMMGLAGSLQSQRREEFLGLLPNSLPATLVTDGYAQLMGASGGRAGICLAIGTGSVIHWHEQDGTSGMAGGWGFPVGDEGSGAWIGMRLLQLYVWHLDGRVQQSPLMDNMASRVGKHVSDIQQWTTASRSSVLAQLAPLVFEQAAAGDSLALSVLGEASEHAMSLVQLAPASLPVYVVGGVGEQLKQHLEPRLGQRLHRAQGDALRGLWLLAQEDH